MKKLREVVEHRTSIRFDAHTYQIIQALAKSNFTTVSAAVRSLVRQYDERMQLETAPVAKTKELEEVD